MGIDYYHCDNCDETFPDCGDVSVRNCSDGHSICSECIDKHLEFVPAEYYHEENPAVCDEDDNIVTKYCPMCNPVKKSDLKQFRVYFKDIDLGVFDGNNEFAAKWNARASMKGLGSYKAVEVTDGSET